MPDNLRLERVATAPPAPGMVSELLFEAGLFEYGVGRVPRLDLAIDGDVPPGFRAVPDFMIALSGADEVAARRTQNPLQLGREV